VALQIDILNPATFGFQALNKVTRAIVVDIRIQYALLRTTRIPSVISNIVNSNHESMIYIFYATVSFVKSVNFSAKTADLSPACDARFHPVAMRVAHNRFVVEPLARLHADRGVVSFERHIASQGID
jgi:hypothetical protein